MIQFLEFTLRSFWTFCGVFLLISLVFGGILKFILVGWTMFWRHWSIRKHGYPPSHCDADGDFKKEKEC